MMEKIKPFCLWLGLSIFLVGIPVLILSLDLGEDSIWGGREKLQKNLQRCFPSERGCVLHHFCEEIQVEKNVRSSFTSYSNLIYILSGLGICIYSYYPNNDTIVNHLREKPYLSLLQGLIFIWTGLTSFLCHASAIPIMRELDRSGVWAITLYPTLYCILRLFDVPSPSKIYHRFVIIYLIILISLTLFHIFYGNQSDPKKDKQATKIIYQAQPILVISMLILVWVENHLQRLFNWLYNNLCPRRDNPTRQEMVTHYRYVFLALIFGILGFLFQFPDRVGLECNPVELPWYHQTHGYWHICISIAMFNIWYLFWTETVVNPLSM